LGYGWLQHHALSSIAWRVGDDVGRAPVDEIETARLVMG
jgi:hypothetical protein